MASDYVNCDICKHYKETYSLDNNYHPDDAPQVEQCVEKIC